MNQADRRNAGSLLVSEFRLKFDQIRTRQVIIKLSNNLFF